MYDQLDQQKDFVKQLKLNIEMILKKNLSITHYPKQIIINR